MDTICVVEINLVFSNINACVVDPKGLDEKSFVDVEVEDGEYVIIPPNSLL